MIKHITIKSLAPVVKHRKQTGSLHLDCQDHTGDNYD